MNRDADEVKNILPGGYLRPRAGPWHVARTSRSAVSTPAIEHAIEDHKGAPARLKQLIQIGIALTSERDVSALLERIVAEARRFTNAEAGTLFLRDGDVLRFAVAQNDVLAERIGEPEMRRQFAARPLPLTQPSLAGHVALTGTTISLPDAYAVPANRPYVFNPETDLRLHSQTGSVLVVPLTSPNRDVIGVLQLINARNAAGEVVPFDPDIESLVQALASQAAVAIRNARLFDQFRDQTERINSMRMLAERQTEALKKYQDFFEFAEVGRRLDFYIQEQILAVSDLGYRTDR